MTKKPKDLSEFEPPSPDFVRRISSFLRFYFSPVYYGLEHLDNERGYLFVANHSIHGALDLILYASDVYLKTGIVLRGLADHFQFTLPIWRDLLQWVGAVPGTAENCKKLMHDNESIIVFPGGGREVCKRKGEAYKLIWKERTGFARLAIENRFPIIPVAVVGMENAFSILWDRDDIMNSILGRLIRKTALYKIMKDGEEMPPITRGVAFTPFPRPEKLYVSFGQPIDTTCYDGRHQDKKAQLALRKIVEDDVNAQIRELLYIREQDTDLSLIRRFLNRL